MSDFRALQEYRAGLDDAGRAELDELQRRFWARRDELNPPRWQLWDEMRRLRHRYTAWLAREHGELSNLEDWLGVSPGQSAWWKGVGFGQELYVRNLSNARVRLLPEWYGGDRMHVTLAPAEPCPHEPARWCLGSGHSQLWCPSCGALGRVSLYRADDAAPLAERLQHELRALESPAWVTWTLPSGC